MNHLALDAATEILSVALHVDSSDRTARLVAVRDVGLRHTQRLMPLVDGLLREAGIVATDLNLVSCTRGPGSFTGLRIGMSTAKGLAAAIAGARALAEPPLVSVPTLDVMAARLPPTGAVVLAVIDGKKGRFYGAVFRGGERLTHDLDATPNELVSAARDAATETTTIVVTGPHAEAFASQLDATGMVIDPGCRSGWAEALLSCAATALDRHGYDPVDLGPDYVRRSDAELGRSGLEPGRSSL